MQEMRQTRGICDRHSISPVASRLDLCPSPDETTKEILATHREPPPQSHPVTFRDTSTGPYSRILLNLVINPADLIDVDIIAGK